MVDKSAFVVVAITTSDGTTTKHEYAPADIESVFESAHLHDWMRDRDCYLLFKNPSALYNGLHVVRVVLEGVTVPDLPQQIGFHTE